jgi:F-type H+-transporting ATPase subunit delta
MAIGLSKVAEPYAEALFNSAKDNIKSLQETKSDMEIVVKFLGNSSDLKKFLGNPLIARTLKKNAIKDILGDLISANTLNFLLLLVDRNRINFLESIVQKFFELYYKEESIAIVQITSAISLSDEQESRLVENLCTIIGVKTVQLACRVDEKLIGGFIIEYGSTMIDRSIRGQFRKISVLLGLRRFEYE